ncbi:MAG: ion channel [Gemmatimonadaceae bacterium]
MLSVHVLSPFIMATREGINDFGFGTVVAEQSKKRLLNRDGSFNVARDGGSLVGALNAYHQLLTMSWPHFLALAAGIYIVVNSLFALGYMMLGPAALQGPADSHTGGFLRAFFFSIETFGTIGFGEIVPATVAANVLVTAESMLQLLAIAVATGVVFARFSRPTARIAYSRKALIAPYRGITAFEFRIANTRSNQIVDLSATVLMAREQVVEGKRTRRFDVLTLERDSVVFFPLSWTIVHPIDATSPLYGMTEADLIASEAEFLVLLRGMDETFSQAVHARTSYTASEVVWGAKFTSLFKPIGDDGVPTIDMQKLHRFEAASVV